MQSVEDKILTSLKKSGRGVVFTLFPFQQLLINLPFKHPFHNLYLKNRCKITKNICFPQIL